MGGLFGREDSTRRIIRKRIFIFLFCIVGLVAATNQAFDQPLQKVTLSYSSSGITSIEFFIAKEKKFFQEEGLEPQLKIKSGPLLRPK